MNKLGVFLCLCWIFSSNIWSQELQFAGVLGNSGDFLKKPVRFKGELVPGMGPVLDDAGGLWERGGRDVLHRYALDGRLLGSYPLPKTSGRSDQLTNFGSQHLVMLIRDRLYLLEVDAESGTEPTRLDGAFKALSSNAWRGKVAVVDQADHLVLLDPVTGEKSDWGKFESVPRTLHFADGGMLYGQVREGMMAWKDGGGVDGFPKPFKGERPQKIGKYWYGHTWHGTIFRYNKDFEPKPGVVMGGASGSFIGYLPQSVDIENGRGLVEVGNGVFAVSGYNGILQLLVWDAEGNKFRLARRIGALAGDIQMALDVDGRIWTPRGSWHWNDPVEAPLSLGDPEPQDMSQPVIGPVGKSLAVLTSMYGRTEWRSGQVMDENGWAHLTRKTFTHEGHGLNGKNSVSAISYETEDKRARVLLANSDGTYSVLNLGANGSLGSKVMSGKWEGVDDLTSLGMLGGQLVAVDSKGLKVFNETAEGWAFDRDFEVHPKVDFVHGDGKRLVMSHTQAGRVSVLKNLDEKPIFYEGLSEPKAVAIQGNRVVVYESGKQHLLKLEIVDATPLPGVGPQRMFEMIQSIGPEDPPFTSADYLDIGLPGGIPCSMAVQAGDSHVLIKVKTPASKVRIGVVIGEESFVTDSTTMYLDQKLVGELRVAVGLQQGLQKERLLFDDFLPIHAEFSKDWKDWAPFDLETYRELVEERRKEIRLELKQPFDGKATVVIENAEGRRVRNLVSGKEFTKGNHSLIWDGLNEENQLVPPGDYKWRVLSHKGIEPEYKMNFANGGEDTTHPWGPNHGVIQQATSNGELIFFSAPVTEGGWALMALDQEGNFVQGYDLQQGFGIGHNAIAVDDQYFYCAQDGFGWGGSKGVNFQSEDWKAKWNITVTRFDVETGKLVEFPGKKRAFVADEMWVGPGADRPDLKKYNLGGLAVKEGVLYVGSREENAVLLFRAKDGELIEQIGLKGVRDLTFHPVSKLLFAATDDGVYQLLKGQFRKVISTLELDIGGIAINNEGFVFLSDRNTHQIHEYIPTGLREPYKAVGKLGVPGGPYKGKYDPKRMVNPAGMAFGQRGKLWVTENRWNPKRVLAWDLSKQDVVFEKFGMPHYGGAGSGFDPENPRRWVGLGCFWDVDIEKGTARPTHVMSVEEGHFTFYHPMSYQFMRQGGREYLVARGHLPLISEILPDGSIRDVVASAGTHNFSYACKWKPPQSYINAFYKIWPEKRKDEKPGGKGPEGKPWSGRIGGVLWVDQNEDGKPQEEEFSFTKEGVQYGGAAWGHAQESLTLRLPVVPDKDTGQVHFTEIQPNKFTNNGQPLYHPLQYYVDKASPLPLKAGYHRNNVPTAQDRFGRVIFNSDPEMNAYRDGKQLWSYPNQWSNVHGSHKAPLPEAGVMQGTLGILGMAEFDDQSDVFFLNGNHGRCFLLTTDGIYLDEVFTDVRVSYLRNEYRLGGEIFGGMFDRSEKDGKYYVQIGHGPYRIYELKGLESVQRSEGMFTVTSEQIIAAQNRNLRKFQEAQVAKDFQIPGKLQWDQGGKFKVQLEAVVHDGMLKLKYQVQDASPWINNGRDKYTLFATGDTVDFQFSTDPNAKKNRRSAATGDKRLLFAPWEGKAIAVLYDHRSKDKENAIEFTSPWRAEKVNAVYVLDQIHPKVQKTKSGYELSAEVPLQLLGLDPSAEILGDFGVTFGDAEGQETQLRSYWANSATMLVDDIPGEIMLHPNMWGTVKF